MGWVKYLVYIASFFVPVFGFITFWVPTGPHEVLVRFESTPARRAGSTLRTESVPPPLVEAAAGGQL